MTPQVDIGGSYNAIPIMVMISIFHINAIFYYLFSAKKKAVSQKVKTPVSY